MCDIIHSPHWFAGSSPASGSGGVAEDGAMQSDGTAQVKKMGRPL